MSGINTNRSNITLPTDVSSEILKKTQEESAIMRLAREVKLSGRGTTIPVILGDPEASWVNETAKKPVSNPQLETKVMTPHKLAVIVPFSDEFARDAKALYDELVRRLPRALAAKFDYTVFGGGTAPASNFDTFASCTAQEIGTDAYGALVAADTDVATHGGVLDGFVISPQGKGILLASKDDNGRPLFINSVAEGAIPMILGAKSIVSKAAYVAGTPATVGIAGDWTQALYGTVEGVKVDFSKEASLTIDNEVVNLWERNMFAVRAEIEVGFRADTTCFNKLTKAAN